MPNSFSRNNIKTDVMKDIIQKINKSKYYTNHGPYSKKIESIISKNFKNINFVALSEVYIAFLIIVEAINSKKIMVIDNKYEDLFEKLTDHKDLEMIKLENFDKSLFHNFLENDGEVVFINTSFIFQNYEYFKSLNIQNIMNFILISEDISQLQEFESIKINLSDKFNFNYLLTLNRSSLTGSFVGSSDDEFNHIIRNYRSSYGTSKIVPVSKTCNARFSEAQAILSLKALSNEVNL